jgi:hypothetical protein
VPHRVGLQWPPRGDSGVKPYLHHDRAQKLEVRQVCYAWQAQIAGLLLNTGSSQTAPRGARSIARTGFSSKQDISKVGPDTVCAMPVAATRPSLRNLIAETMLSKQIVRRTIRCVGCATSRVKTVTGLVAQRSASTGTRATIRCSNPPRLIS